MDDTALAALNQRCDPDFAEQGPEGHITLTTHNHRAEKINDRRMTGLPGREKRFQGMRCHNEISNWSTIQWTTAC